MGKDFSIDTASRIAVLGGGGRTGNIIVEEIIARGGRPSVLVRSRAGFSASGGVDVIVGDARDGQALSATLRGAQALIDATGPRPDSGDRWGTEIARNVIDTMMLERVPRLVVISGAMIGGGELPFMYRMILAMMKAKDKRILEDRREAEKIVMASKLKWTILRPPRLSDGEPTGKIAAGAALPLRGGSTIRRADLAAYAVECSVSDKHMREAVRVSEGA